MACIRLCPLLALAFLFVADSCATSWIVHSDQLIQQVCKKTIDYQFCLQALNSDPSSKSADITGLGYISLNLTKGFAFKTGPYIKELIGQAKENKTRNCLIDCSSFYTDAIRDVEDATSALRAKDYSKMNIDASAAIDQGVTCEDGFIDANVPSPLTSENNSLQRLAGIVAAISNMLPEKLA